MTRTIRQPSLAELTDRMLAARLSSQTVDAPEAEVEPHEVLNGFRTDPRTAFTESVSALKLLGMTDLPTSLPPEWSSYVQAATGSPAIPMAAGQFPQRVRDAAGLMEATDLTEFAPTALVSVAGFQNLTNWTKKHSNSVFALGVARALGEKPTITGSDAVAINGGAANAWMSGQHAEAVKMWATMPDSPVAAFNRGMSLLFTGKAEEAVPHLAAAVEGLPETSGWNHLAALYLTVARTR